MRIVISGILLVAFLISYNLFLYKLATEVCDLRIMGLWNDYSILALIVGVFVLEGLGERNGFLDICKVILLITILTHILTKHAILLNPYYSLGMIDLGTAIVTLMILISGGRHGIFTEK